MISFLLCLAILIGGYFVYGKIVDNTFGPDDRETPAVRINDGVDYVVMPQWKLFLVQLLNIAGLGPIFGILFYLLVVFAAISSSISLLEVIVAHFVDKARDEGKGDKRKSYTLIAAACVGLGCILVCADRLGASSFSPAELLNIANPKTWAADWLDFWDALSEGVMMPLGALLMSLMIDKRVIIAYTLNNPKVIRIEPPLIMPTDVIDQVLTSFREAVSSTAEVIEDL